MIPGGRIRRLGVVVVASIAWSAHVPSARAIAPDVQSVADSIVKLADRGRRTAADSLAQQGLRLARKRHGARSLEYAVVIDAAMQAAIQSRSAISPHSIRLAKQAVSIKRLRSGPTHPGVAASLRLLGRLQEATGDYAGARESLRSGLAILGPSQSNQNTSLADFLNDYGALLGRMCEYDSAEHYLRKALAIRETVHGGAHLAVAQSMNALGLVYAGQADYARARSSYERALAIRETIRGPTHPDVAGPCNNLGLLLTKIGDFDSAEGYLQRALEIRRATLKADSPVIGSTLANLAWLAGRRGDAMEARRYYQQAMEVYSRSVGTEHPMVASALVGLAEVQRASGDYAAARGNLGRALRIREKAFGHRSHDVADCLLLCSQVEAEAGNVDAALAFGARALDVQRAIFGTRHFVIAAHLTSRAEVEARRGNRDIAMDLVLEAESIEREHLQLAMRAMPESEALAFTATKRAYDVAVALAGSEIGGAARRAVLDRVIRSRGLVFDEVSARQEVVRNSADAEIAAAQERLRRAQRTLLHLVTRAPEHVPGDFRALIAKAERARAAAERDVATRMVHHRRDSRSESGIAAIDAAARPGDVIVSYVVHDKLIDTTSPAKAQRNREYTAFVHRAGRRHPSVVRLGDAATIDAAVREWLRDIATSGTADRRRSSLASGAALRRLIWDPIDTDIRAARRLLVVPDGMLNLVNLYALPTAGELFLVETSPAMCVMSAERDLLRRTPGRHSGNGMLVVGDPDFDGEDRVAGATSTTGGASARVGANGLQPDCVDVSPHRLEGLPAARREAVEVSTLWRRSRIGDATLCVTGAEATEELVKREAPGRAWLHIATHGVVISGDCTAAARAGSRGVEAERSVSPQQGSPQSVRIAALALAGANRRTTTSDEAEDGVLTTEEIAGMNLSGVECVVLSACASGGGDIVSGEGVLGLQRAVRIAGARGTIVSLWPVQDDAAQAWMQALYSARCDRRMDLMTAVRHATLERLRVERARGNESSASAWAAFVATGRP